MCGLCGFVDFQRRPVDPDLSRRMLALIAHRGPDGLGSMVRQPVADQRAPSVFLGHTRLRVIDLSQAADQPIPNEDETIWVSLNGEIYNFIELREALQAKGHRFRSRSDTEVIVHAYEEFGDEFIRHLDGMFAVSLWDQNRGRLVLARDRAGKKPLFYSHDHQRLTYGSEMKALLACPWITDQVAEHRIPELLCHGYVPGTGTMFERISEVPPGSILSFSERGLSDPSPYWSLRFDHSTSAPPFSEAIDRTRFLITEATRKRLVSDAPLGALLSGGLDSAIIVGLASQLSDRPLKTFTVGFNRDPGFDERVPARAAAEAFGTSHTEISVDIDVPSIVEGLLWHHEQPYGDESAVPTFLVSRAAREHVTVVLNGDGGDESFAGYNRFKGAVVGQRVPMPLAKLAGWFARAIPDNDRSSVVRRYLMSVGLRPWQRFLDYSSIIGPTELTALMKPGLTMRATADAIYEPLSVAATEAGNIPLLHQLMHVHFTTSLPDALLVKADRTSMAIGLEARSPFLDTAVIEYLASLPPSYKINRLRTKWLLRETFKHLVPPTTLRQPKRGFDPPVDRWFREDLRPMMEDVLLTPDARSADYLEPVAIKTLFDKHLAGARNGRKLWLLLNLELWLRGRERSWLLEPQPIPGRAV